VQPDNLDGVVTYLTSTPHPARTALVLLHGTGGDEASLLPFARQVAPTSGVLTCRGTVPIEGGYAFFRRHPDRRIDEVDLKARVRPLAEALAQTLNLNHITAKPVVIGYSNGAIMATALMQACPDLLSGAVLLRAMSPFSEEPEHPEPGPPVLIIDGMHDDRRAPHDGRRVATALRRAGTSVSHHILPIGHAITDSDAFLVRDWLALL